MNMCVSMIMAMSLCILGSPIVGQMFFRATLFTSYYQVKVVVACRDGLHYNTVC